MSDSTEVTVPSGSRLTPWLLPATLMVTLVTAGVLATASAWTDLFSRARRDEELSYILLVPFIAGWLVWVRRHRFRPWTFVGQWFGSLCVASGWLLYVTGDQYAIESAWYAGAVLVAVGALASVSGRITFWRFAPAFGVLLFLLPVPGMLRAHVADPLQTVTAALVQRIFEGMGFMVTRSGNLLHVNAEPVAIAEACNGLRMVFALVLVAYTVAFTLPLRSWVRVLLLVCSPILAIGCNVIRLVPTLWAYGALPRGTAESLHDIGGWAMVGVALILLLALLQLMRWLELPIDRNERRSDGLGS